MQQKGYKAKINWLEFCTSELLSIQKHLPGVKNTSALCLIGGQNLHAWPSNTMTKN
jgi:hypothetical protein